jgi:hypothetical protein
MMKVKAGMKSLVSSALAVSMLALVQPAHASIITLTGADFDVVYNSATLGLFSTPVLVGNTLFFTPSAFIDQSTNGQGTVNNSSTASGIQLIAHAGYQFGNLAIGAEGDYLMTGANSSVGVVGQFIAQNDAAPLTKTSSAMVLDPGYPLNIKDGATHDWVGSSSITDSTPTDTPGHNPWLGSASTIDVTLWNELTATTVASDPGQLQATIQEKFAGVQLYVDPIPTPLPNSVLLLLSTLGVLGGMSRSARRKAQDPPA